MARHTEVIMGFKLIELARVFAQQASVAQTQTAADKLKGIADEYLARAAKLVPFAETGDQTEKSNESRERELQRRRAAPSSWRGFGSQAYRRPVITRHPRGTAFMGHLDPNGIDKFYSSIVKRHFN